MRREACDSVVHHTVVALEAGDDFDEIGQIMAYEGGDLGEVETIALFQHLLDSGLCWRLQGHYGRTATALLQSGCIHLTPREEL